MFKNNPIFFKDLLIALNSKQGKIVIFFFIFIYFITFLLFLAEIKFGYNFYKISSIGKELFTTVGISQLFVLTGIGFFRGLQSFTTEKSKKTLDFIKISPISSKNFVLGKFLASISFIMLLFIVSLPFISIGLVLGGINISDILIYSLFTFSYSSFAVLLGMLLSSLAKNTIQSILYGILFVPIIIFFIIFFMGFTIDYFGFNLLKNGSENIIYSLLPISIFNYISDSNKYINLFTFKIHYLVFHTIFFTLLNGFLFQYITNQYKKFSTNKLQVFNYFGTIILTITFSLFSNMYYDAIFGLIFSSSIFIYLFYLFNNNSISKKIKFGKNIFKNKYSYFLITYLIIAILIIIFYGFLFNTILLLFLIFLLLFTFQDFLRTILQKISSGIFNITYLLIIILFFYIAPLISTNLLNIKFNTVNSLIKTSLYEDNAQKYTCINKNSLNPVLSIKKDKNKNEHSWFSSKCRGIDKNGTKFYYILYFILNLIFISSVLISGKRKKD